MVKKPTTKKPAAKKTDRSLPNRRTLSVGRKHMVDIIVGAVEKVAATGEVIRQTVNDTLEAVKSQNERLVRIERIHEDTDKQVEHLRALLLPEGTIVERYAERIRELEEQLMEAERKHARAMGYIDCILDGTVPQRVLMNTREVQAAHELDDRGYPDHSKMKGWREVYSELERVRGPKES